MNDRAAAPRYTTIEGRRTAVVERTPPIPATLDRLLAAMFAFTVSEDIRPLGARPACEALRTHRFGVLREGRHHGIDRVLRDLRVEMCRDCGAVCVRDVSYDRLPGLTVGARGPRRKDMILGWYSGARRAGREYR